MHFKNPRTQILLTLGEPDTWHLQEWPDYVSLYGFTTDDAPDLLALFAQFAQFTDESIETLPTNPSEVWAPVYAWRILGQLRCEAAIAPLIASFDRLCDDDAALSELSRAVGMIGPSAIPALVQHLQQLYRDEFSRIMAIDSLCEIALLHPGSRDSVLSTYRAYLNNPDTIAYVLNGILMGRLLDLHATELITEIRQLFALDCVELTSVGDVEDMEIEMGLRMERETPKPNYADWASLKGLEATRPFDFDDDFDFDEDDLLTKDHPVFGPIDKYLLRYGSDDSVLGVSELDGFFAALACAPVSIMPSTWLPELWGGEQRMPQWEEDAEFREFTIALFLHYNQVMGDFLNDDYEPLFLQSIEIATELLVVEEWCEGFLRGLVLWGTLSAEDSARLDEWLLHMLIFCTKDGNAALAEMEEFEIVQLQQRIQPTVVSIRQYFFKPVKHANTTVVHASPKVGRNDPCPCGSGKKHKKCCGLH